jgi:hypothetical protein
MATFTDLVKNQRESGSGVIGSLGSAIGQKTKERLDPRNLLFKRNGLMTALFPGLKGYQTKISSSEKLKSKELSMAGGQVDALNEKFAVVVKNTMALPMMARDMNIMRQNIVKLVRVMGGKPSNRADAFFLKAKERENAYESQFGKKTSPTRVGMDEKAKKENESWIGSILRGLLKGGLFAAALFGIGKYFSDPEFRKSVNDMLNNLGSAIFGSEYWTSLKKDIKDNLVEGALIVGGSYLAFKVALGLLTSALTGASSKIGAVTLALARNPYVLGAAALGIGAYEINKYRKSKKVGQALDSGNFKEFRDSIWKVGAYDHEADQETAEETQRLNAETVATLQKIAADESATAYRRGVARSYLIGISKGDLKLPEPKDMKSETSTPSSLSPEQLKIQKQIEDLGMEARKKDTGESRKMQISAQIADLQKQKRKLKPSTPTPATTIASTTPSQQMGGDITFNSLTREQQEALFAEQRIQEGFKPGTVSYDLNNPGNILYTGEAAKFGGVPDTTGRGVGDVKGKFARFPTLAAGLEAQRDLWSRKYGDIPLSQAIASWTGSNNNYASEIYAAINKPMPAGGNTTMVASNNNTGSSVNQQSSFMADAKVFNPASMMQTGLADIASLMSALGQNISGLQSSPGANPQLSSANPFDTELAKFLTNNYIS